MPSTPLPPLLSIAGAHAYPLHCNCALSRGHALAPPSALPRTSAEPTLDAPTTFLLSTPAGVGMARRNGSYASSVGAGVDEAEGGSAGVGEGVGAGMGVRNGACGTMRVHGSAGGGMETRVGDMAMRARVWAWQTAVVDWMEIRVFYKNRYGPSDYIGRPRSGQLQKNFPK